MEVLSSSENANDQLIPNSRDVEEDQSRQRRSRNRGCLTRGRSRRRQLVEVFDKALVAGYIICSLHDYVFAAVL